MVSFTVPHTSNVGDDVVRACIDDDDYGSCDLTERNGKTAREESRDRSDDCGRGPEKKEIKRRWVQKKKREKSNK